VIKKIKKKVSLTLNYRKKRVNRKYKEHTLHAQTKKGSSLKDKKKRLSKLLEEKLLEEVSSSSSGEDENLNELLNNDKKKGKKKNSNPSIDIPTLKDSTSMEPESTSSDSFNFSDKLEKDSNIHSSSQSLNILGDLEEEYSEQNSDYGLDDEAMKTTTKVKVDTLKDLLSISQPESELDQDYDDSKAFDYLRNFSWEGEIEENTLPNSKNEEPEEDNTKNRSEEEEINM